MAVDKSLRNATKSGNRQQLHFGKIISDIPKPTEIRSFLAELVVIIDRE